MIRLLPLLVLLGACAPEGPRGDDDCFDDGDCSGLAVCGDDHRCRAVGCLDSTQCPLGNHCNLDAHTCFTGCQEDSDCLPGDTCDPDSTECVTSACTDSEIDCWYGETCDVSLGECTLPEAHCRSCSEIGWSTCTQDWAGTCIGGLCHIGCAPGATGGPRGFTCSDLWNDGSYYWWGECESVDFDRHD